MNISRTITLDLSGFIKHNKLTPYEKWLDFEEKFEIKENEKEEIYFIRGLSKIKMTRKDKEDKVILTYSYKKNVEKEVNKIVENNLLKKLHPDTRESITIK